MLMPALFSKEFAHLSSIENEEKLFEKLKENIYFFIPFFILACEDETWMQKYNGFTKLSIKWLSELFAKDLIPFQLAKTVANSLRDHHAVLEPFIPLDLTCRVGDHLFQINSILFGSGSDFLHDYFVKECVGRNPMVITFKGVNWEVFTTLAEWLNKGNVDALWKREEVYLWKVLRQASIWGMLPMVEFVQEILRRYLNRVNVLDHLILCHEQEWHYLKKACCDLINSFELGALVFDRGVDALGFEFLEFTTNSLDLFEHLRKWLTHLVFSKSLSEEAAFSEVIGRCPKLLGLDLSRSRIFSERLYDIPPNLEELDLSMCGWLTPGTVRKFAEICPHLIKLNLSSNGQLRAAVYSELYKFKDLQTLDVSRCHQITDDELKLLLKACPQLVEFKMEESNRITDTGFLLISTGLLKLTSLSLARCGIGDIPLIEIVTRCQQLQRLNLTRCENITDKSIAEMGRQAKMLRELNLTHCAVSQHVVEQMKMLRPDLTILQ